MEYMGSVYAPAENMIMYKTLVEEAVGEDGSWEGVGVYAAGEPQISNILNVQSYHEDLLIGCSDVTDELFQAIQEGKALFGIEQNAYLQGYLPVALLTWQAYTDQMLVNRLIETGAECSRP